MPQVSDLTLPVGDAGANVTFNQIDIQDGLATWRESDAAKSIRAQERISAKLSKPAGQQRNYIATVRAVLPCMSTVDGVETVTHTNHVEMKVTISPDSTSGEAAHVALVAQEILKHALITEVISEVSGLY